jgi:hypothetical protein
MEFETMEIKDLWCAQLAPLSQLDGDSCATYENMALV